MVAAHPLSISLHASRLEAVDEVCDATLGCGGSDLLGQLLLLVVTGLLLVFVLAAVQHVRSARSAVDEERSRTATEQHAFARFARTVSRLEPTSTAPFVGGDGDGGTLAASGGPPRRDLQAVVEAYEETVLSMPHYEEEYDEPLARHMSEEFGAEVATAVAAGDRLTPGLQEVLVERAREAATDRERLITRLDDERAALDDAAEELERLGASVDDADGRRLAERTFDQLVDEWHRLGETESRLRRLLDHRQRQLASDAGARRADRPSLQRYLYGGLDTTYPVLADGSAMGERIKAARSRVLHALTRRA